MKESFDHIVHSCHIETVVCLDKKKSKDYVEIGVDAGDYYRIKDSGKSYAGCHFLLRTICL